MPKLLPQPVRGAPFTVAEAVDAGLTRRMLEGPRFRRLFHGIYVDASLPDSVRLRADAAAKLLPPNAVFSGLTTAELLGIPVPLSSHVAALVDRGERRPRIRGIKVSVRHRPSTVAMTVRRRRLLAPEFVFIDLALSLNTEDLVVAGDALLNRGWTSLQALYAVTNEARWPGVVAARAALSHLEPRSASPGETRARLNLVRLGFPRPRAGVVILDEHHGWIAEVDLLNDDPPVVFQYDGEVHYRTWQQRRSDAIRDEAVRDLGWEVMVLTNRDLGDDVRLKRRAAAAFRRADGRRVRGFTREGSLPTLRLAAS